MMFGKLWRLSLFLITTTLASPVCAENIPTQQADIELQTIARDLENPWSIAFLPDTTMLVTERAGRLRQVWQDGRVGPPIRGIPAVKADGQGGLLDVLLDPDFAHNRQIYLSYAEERTGGAGTSVARGVLNDDATALENLTVIFRQHPAVIGPVHFGSRLVFARDGTLFITTGERGYMARAQQLDNHFGKVIRIKPDGSVPADNPFLKSPEARPEIWSYGHRNMQGAALHPVTGELWTTEHGPKGGDEVNIPRAGKNYGWPIITYGIDYDGTKIGQGSHRAGMEQPVHYWVPSIATSGMMFYTGAAFPKWQGNLFIAGLAGSTLSRLTLEGEKVTAEERLLTGLGHRYRDIRQGQDGLIYLLTDDPKGILLRITPAK